MSQSSLGHRLWIPPLGWELGYLFWGWTVDRSGKAIGRVVFVLALASVITAIVPLSSGPAERARVPFRLNVRGCGIRNVLPEVWVTAISEQSSASRWNWQRRMEWPGGDSYARHRIDVRCRSIRDGLRRCFMFSFSRSRDLGLARKIFAAQKVEKAMHQRRESGPELSHNTIADERRSSSPAVT